MSTKWNVVFTAPGAIVVLTVESDDEESAIYLALEQAQENMGLDLANLVAEATPAYDSDVLL
jgi:hypothetical protein